MRITIVTGFFLPVPPLMGGATEKIWDRLAREFAAAGHAVTLISRSWPGLAERETAAGVTHIRLPGADHTRSLARNLWLDARWGLRVARALPPGDVVVCNTVTLPVWLRRFRPAAGRVAAVVARMPKGQGRFYGGVDLLLALSDPVRERLVAENPRLAGRIAPFPFPIDWELHARAGEAARASTHAGPASPAGGSPLVIGYIGRVHPEKGVRLLLEAASILAARPGLPDWRLDIVGPHTVPQGGGGPAFRDGLERDFGATLGPRLRWVGPEFDPGRLARLYGGLAIFCYPSLADRGETFGVAVAEGMAAGAAPVVSALPCFGELVADGVTGLVFDHTAPDAPDRLAAALGRLLADPSLRLALAAAAQERAKRFDYAAQAAEVLKRLAQLK